MKNEVMYTIKNPVMFAFVMQKPELCIGLIERIFPGHKVKEMRFVYTDEESGNRNDPIRRIEAIDPQTEKTCIVGIEAKSIRMDVLFENNDVWYDIEMQVNNIDNLPKRTRYYHAVKAVESFKRGWRYDALKAGFVIFINTFDLFGLGKPIYSFQMYDSKNSLPLGDEQYTIFLNSSCKNDVPGELEGFYRYLQTGEVPAGDSWLAEMAAAVEDANHREEVRSKVTLYDEIQLRDFIIKETEELNKRSEERLKQQTEILEKNEALLQEKTAILEKNEALLQEKTAILEKNEALLQKNEELLKQRDAQVDSLKKKAEKIKQLNVLLIQQGRTEDLLRATEDEEYCAGLFEEFGL